MNSHRPLARLLTIILPALVLIACTQAPLKEASPTGAQAVMLTNEAIFRDWEYQAIRPGELRWAEEGAAFVTLETAPDYEDAVLEKDRYGDDIEIYQEVVQYHPETLERTVLISLDQLKPPGTDKALVIDDYKWSDDKTKVLIYTGAEYVWRRKTRGDYWLLNLANGELWQLGGDLTEPSRMMFGKFSPDSGKFAYVWRDNIYVQDLATRQVRPLTNDASETIINGFFDWAYEEEFGIRDGFRWSPDSQRIAYWQLDMHAARDFFIVNNTD